MLDRYICFHLVWQDLVQGVAVIPQRHPVKEFVTPFPRNKHFQPATLPAVGGDVVDVNVLVDVDDKLSLRVNLHQHLLLVHGLHHLGMGNLTACKESWSPRRRSCTAPEGAGAPREAFAPWRSARSSEPATSILSLNLGKTSGNVRFHVRLKSQKENMETWSLRTF